MKHCGLNARIIERLVSHRAFPEFLCQVREAIIERVVSHPAFTGLFTIGMFCGSGYHRSVAVREVLTYCLRREGHVVFRHAAAGWSGWLYHARICPECCAKGPPGLLERAFGVWRGSGQHDGDVKPDASARSGAVKPEASIQT